MKLDLSTSASKRSRPSRPAPEVERPGAEDALTREPASAEPLAREARTGILMRPSLSLLSSVLIHCCLVVFAGLLTMGGEAAAPLPGEVVELGLLPDDRLDPNQFSADQLDESQPQDTLTDSELAMPEDPLAEVDQLEAVTPSTQIFGAGGGAASASGLGGGGSGAGGQASFMGVQAYGRRFCIIADRSGSMKGQPLAHVKEEIRSTLKTMTLRSYVHLVFYSNSWHAFPESWARPREIQDDADLWLRDLHSAGGTNPAPAFDHAFSLEPPPDAIFFMTDGRIPPNMDAHVARLNSLRSKKIQVHTIAFLNRAAGPLLERIAHKSGGKFRYVAGF